MSPATLLLALVLLLHVCTVGARNHLPVSHRNSVAQRSLKNAPKESTGHVWKLGLIGLAALSFLIRKRL